MLYISGEERFTDGFRMGAKIIVMKKEGYQFGKDNAAEIRTALKDMSALIPENFSSVNV